MITSGFIRQLNLDNIRQSMSFHGTLKDATRIVIYRCEFALNAVFVFSDFLRTSGSINE